MTLAHDRTAEAALPARAGPGEIFQAWLLLLPALALAWPGPGAFLASDLAPHISGAGVAALATLPAVLVMLARRAAPKVGGLELFLVPLLIGVVWFTSGHASDTLESSRALMVSVTGLVLMLCAASLGDGGRAALARGTVLISLAVVGTAFARRDELTGALGNTGSIAQSALAGAVIGAYLTLRGRAAWRILGAAAWILFALYCVIVPVLSAAIAAGIALAVTAVADTRSARTARIAWMFLGIAPLGALSWKLAHPPAPPIALVGRIAPSSPDHTSGARVRALVAGSGLRMLRDHVWTGVGPGQFAAAFPPYRDPREIEISSLGRKLEAETEVEHAHDDWLEVVLETGVIGGAAWLAFLCFAGASAIGTLRRAADVAAPIAEHAALATSILALLASALANATFTHEPLASSLAFVSIGAVLSKAVPERVPVSRRFVFLAAVALLVLCAPRAYKFVQHGRALAAFAELAARAPAPRDDDAEREAASRELQRALTACPDSVLARSLAVRDRTQFDGWIIDAFDEHDHLSAIAPPRAATPEEIEAEWRAILALRPHRFEAWMQLGVLAATHDRSAEARECFEKAIALDPTHPGLLMDLVTLESSEGHIESALAYLDRLLASHPPANGWVESTAARLTLSGHDREAAALFARVKPELATGTPAQDYERAKEYGKRGEKLLAAALESRAHRGWAREHAGIGHWSDAVRSYRQAQRAVEEVVSERATRLELELAAALLLANREADAHTLATGLTPHAADWDALPDWARDRLRDTRWFER